MLLMMTWQTNIIYIKLCKQGNFYSDLVLKTKKFYANFGRNIDAVTCSRFAISRLIRVRAHSQQQPSKIQVRHWAWVRTPGFRVKGRVRSRSSDVTETRGLPFTQQGSQELSLVNPCCPISLLSGPGKHVQLVGNQNNHIIAPFFHLSIYLVSHLPIYPPYEEYYAFQALYQWWLIQDHQKKRY